MEEQRGYLFKLREATEHEVSVEGPLALSHLSAMLSCGRLTSGPHLGHLLSMCLAALPSSLFCFTHGLSGEVHGEQRGNGRNDRRDRIERRENAGYRHGWSSVEPV
jgi:hypothetical protein